MAALQRLIDWRRARHKRRLRDAAAIVPAPPEEKSARIRRTRAAIFFVAVVAACIALDSGAIFAWMESYAYNIASSSRADIRPSTARVRTDIVLVTLSDSFFSAANFAERPTYPVPRSYHARLLDNLSGAGARTVVFDMLFEASKPQDKEFAAAIRRARQRGTRVIAGCLTDDDGHWLLPNKTIRDAGAELGHILVIRKADHPAIERLEATLPGPGGSGDLIPALSLKAARIVQPNVAPPLEDGTFAIRYAGKAGELFPVQPYEEVLMPGSDQDFFKKFWNGKTVMVGDTTKIGQDYQDTPLGVMPGLEVHAHALNTLLQGEFLVAVPAWLRALCIFLIALPVAWFFDTGRARVLIGSFLVLLVGYSTLFFWLFMYHDYVLHLVGPVVALLTVTLGVLIERSLYEEQERQRMFDALVMAASSAIESRDPSTAGHSRRVTCLTVELAIAVSALGEGPFRKVRYTRTQIKELCYSALLHDFGKIGVREAVLTKSHKLEPLHFQAVKYRVLLLKNGRQREYMDAKIAMLSDAGDEDKESLDARLQALDEEMWQEMDSLDRDVQLLERANNPQITYLPDEQYESLRELLDRMESHAFYDEAGERRPLISPEEKIALSIRKGSLTEDEYKQIQQHAQLSYEFLKQISWTRDFKSLAYIAWGHHEKLSGKGYPRGVTEKDIPLVTRMMTIADIFDALTASDRPYKKALPVEKALEILDKEAKANDLDRDLLQVFVEGRIYEALNDGRSAWLFPAKDRA